MSPPSTSRHSLSLMPRNLSNFSIYNSSERLPETQRKPQSTSRTLKNGSLLPKRTSGSEDFCKSSVSEKSKFIFPIPVCHYPCHSDEGRICSHAPVILTKEESAHMLLSFLRMQESSHLELFLTLPSYAISHSPPHPAHLPLIVYDRLEWWKRCFSKVKRLSYYDSSVWKKI